MPRLTTRDIAVMAVLTALLSASKTALAVFPNIEITTTLFIVYALVLGLRRSLIISLAFILIDCFIWGIGWWVILYLIHWNALVIAVSVLPKAKLQIPRTKKELEIRIPCSIVIGIALTAGFSITSTLIEIIMMGALGSPYFSQYFYYRYLSGISFFATHIISNSIILPILVPFMYPLTNRLYRYNTANRNLSS